MLIDYLGPHCKEQVKSSIREHAESFPRGEFIELRFPYLIVAAIKVASPT